MIKKDDSINIKSKDRKQYYTFFMDIYIYSRKK